MKARQAKREREENVRQFSGDYISRLLRNADKSQAVSSERIRRYGRGKVISTFSSSMVYNDDITQTEIDAVAACVADKLVKEFSDQWASDLPDQRVVDHVYPEFVMECRQKVAGRVAPGNPYPVGTTLRLAVQGSYRSAEVTMFDEKQRTWGIEIESPHPGQRGQTRLVSEEWLSSANAQAAV